LIKREDSVTGEKAATPQRDDPKTAHDPPQSSFGAKK